MTENLVILELSPEDRKRLKSRWGAAKGDNITSISQGRFWRDMMRLMDGLNSKETGK